MNKKYLFGMFAAASLLLATSCSDELESGSAGNMATVSFKLDVEGGAQSRAISDGSQVNKLIYAVFDGDGNRLTEVEKVERKNVSFPVNETITLVKGQSYKIAFWAQNDSCGAYSVDEDMTLSIDYTDGINNDESRDAFFKTIDVYIENNSASTLTDEVVLERPFAQLNVGVDKKDWDDAVDRDITIVKSDVTISNVASKMNLVTGTVSEVKENILYKQNAIPAQMLTLTNDKDGDDKDGDDNDGTMNDFAKETEEFHYLSMSYILVDDDTEGGANRALIDKVSFNFYPAEDGKIINFSKGLENIPVRRNWRTNIVGKLLTSNVDYNISIEPGYDGETNIDGTIYATDDELTIQEKIEKGGVVTFADNITDVIDFTKYKLKSDVYLKVNKTVPEIIVGGNNDGDQTRNATSSTKPNVVIEIAEGVEYPKITFAGYAENYVIKGNSDKQLSEILTLYDVKDVTVSGITFNNNIQTKDNHHIINLSGAVDGLTIEKCTVSDLGVAFIKAVPATGKVLKNVTVQGNNITCKNGSQNEGLTHIQDPLYFKGINGLTIKGNTINYSMTHHAIYTYGCNDVTVHGNTINKANDDAIKIDVYGGNGATVTDNTIVSATNNGIRFDNFEAEANIVITGNTISSRCSEDAAYGINIKSGKVKKHTANIKNNIIGEAGIANGRYCNIADDFILTGDYETPLKYEDGIVVFADGSLGVETIAQLEYAVNTLNSSEISVKLMKDITGNANVEQREGVNVSIFGQGHSYDGSIIIDGNSKSTNEETLTIDNIKFNTSSSNENVDFIKGATAANGKQITYPHNVTVQNCSFGYAGTTASIVALRATQWYNTKMQDCTVSENLHSAIQGSGGGRGLHIENVTGTCREGGFNLGTIPSITIKNVKVTAEGDYGYGVRVDANAAATPVLKIESCEFNADAPIVLRKSTTGTTYTIELTGDNTLTPTKTNEYQIIATKGNWNASTALATPEGTVTITGAEGMKIHK